MARLTEGEKRELLRLANSETLRRDMRILRRNNLERQRQMSPADYLEFLKFAQSFSISNSPKLRKIKGKNFKL